MIFRSPYPDVTVPEISLTEYVLQRAEELADKPALIDGPSGRTLSYGQLAGAIRKCAAGLAQSGFAKGDVFAIYSPNLPEYAVIFHAVASLGGTNTTVNPLYTVDELARQLKDCGAKYLITIELFLENAKQAAQQCGVEKIFVFGEAEGAIPFAELLDNDGEPPQVTLNLKEDLAVLPYSSGTTGIPKGVMLTHYNMVANMCQIKGYRGLTIDWEKQTLVGVLPFFHIYGMVVILNYTLSQGATVVTMPRFDMEQFLGILQEYKITFMHLVPPILLGLAKHPMVDQFDLSNLRGVLCGAAPLGEGLAREAAQRLGCIIVQGYGLTETSPVTHIGPSEEGLQRPASAGQCVPNTEVKIVDIASKEELGPNQEGEILVRGPQVMKGYLNNPEATAAVMEGGWFHTGDIGYADEQGYFYVVDRLKELIKYKGYQVAPAELEALLLTHPAVTDAAVIPSPDEEAGEVPKAFVVLREDTPTETLMSFVAEQVAPHKRIRLMDVVEEIPKSLSGKILRRVLVEQERARAAGGS
ncbi:MAG: 4-coumarate--CoA ligase family protein [SAR324 cluster bacterium]|nr:4-coumarate--CoA ligase family protein [SAR324 cluster bacterium]